ncbi:hypothetical protein HJG60_011150 [Phyllostomus discolor]|uniref:Uncharacterized protein n=1 Tax=Phyllostomus discolor TaxID=89673 RepID=A0A833ZX14_9CHIR|nr:hypothetical protein HJG60_011150 [Phyllostomus discolor]
MGGRHVHIRAPAPLTSSRWTRLCGGDRLLLPPRGWGRKWPEGTPGSPCVVAPLLFHPVLGCVGHHPGTKGAALAAASKWSLRRVPWAGLPEPFRPWEGVGRVSRQSVGYSVNFEFQINRK